MLDKRVSAAHNLGMIFGHGDYPETYRALLTHQAWKKALEWIQNMPAGLPLGEHVIDGKNMFANYHEATLLPREEGTYEAHRDYIDVHYCLAGGEIIEWARVETLTPTMPYDAEKDYTLYAVPPHASTCLMAPKSFAIFFPGEAHMPKIKDGKNAAVRKVVVKIKTDLL